MYPRGLAEMAICIFPGICRQICLLAEGREKALRRSMVTGQCNRWLVVCKRFSVAYLNPIHSKKYNVFVFPLMRRNRFSRRLQPHLDRYMIEVSFYQATGKAIIP